MGQHQQSLRRRLKFWHYLAVFGIVALLVASCVTNPITGKQQFNMVGKSQLLSLAREAAPSQFAADYGIVDDAQANAYVSQIGRKLVALTVITATASARGKRDRQAQHHKITL